jgi:hypothetical protein
MTDPANVRWRGLDGGPPMDEAEVSTGRPPDEADPPSGRPPSSNSGPPRRAARPRRTVHHINSMMTVMTE